MHSYRSSAMLKTMARGQLLGKYPIAAAAFLSVTVMSGVLQLLFFLLVDQSTMAGVFVYTVVTFIISLLLGVLNAGVLFMALKICCKETVSLRDIFYGFSYQTNKIVTIYAVINGAGLLFQLPATIFLRLFAQTERAAYFLPAACFIVLGAGVYCYVSLLLSQAVFLLLDFADRSPRELMRMSAHLMKGQKGRLFYLWVSFIPMLLLSLFTCCIGYIWMIPYFQVTSANFYMDLAQNYTPER